MQTKTDAASIIARYVSLPPASARAIAAQLSDDRRNELESNGIVAARVAEIVNEFLAAADKAAADEQ